MKNSNYLPILLTSSLLFSACGMTEECENEASQVRIHYAGGDFNIDTFEASRTNATGSTQGNGVTMACNFVKSIPWSNVTYEDARNACLDARKRLCTKEEWMAACGQSAYPYGDTYKPGTCVDGDAVEVGLTGGKPDCKSSSGIFDMSGNLREWVEGGILMGGGYSSASTEGTCDSAKAISDPLSYTPSAADGFRCCADVSAL